jgi:hypothetical protein
MSEQADQGGGTLAESSDGSDTGDGTPQDQSAIPGVPTYWVYADDETVVNEETGASVGLVGSNGSDSESLPDSTLPVDGDQIDLGDVSGLGDALMINFADASSLDNHTFGGPLPWTPVLLVPRAIAVSQPSFGLESNIHGLIAPLDFAFTLNTGDTLKPTISTVSPNNVSPGLVDDTRLVLDGSTVVDSRFGSDRTPTDRRLLNSSGNDRVVAVVPSLINAKDQNVASMHFGAVDIVLDGWKPDSPD